MTMQPDTPLSPGYIDPLLREALREDLHTGDVTCDALFHEPAPCRAYLLAREGGIAAGLPLAGRVFTLLQSDAAWEPAIKDGERFAPGTELATLRADAANILRGERTALNFLQRLCGIATLTARFVAAAAPFGVRILDTRKTTPNLRRLEKYAVVMGGGHNHRFGLYDMAMIKENHIRRAGGIAAAVRAVRKQHGARYDVEVEAETTAEAEEARRAGADRILLDNMSLDELRQAAAMVAGRVPLEASGGITLDSVADIAATGIDDISVGALTHSARALDISLQVLS